MPHFEHTTTVAKPIEHVAAVLTAPEGDHLYAPAIIRITLDDSADGRAADLTYEQLHTTASPTPERTEQGRNRSTRIGAPFTGSGVDGTIAYRLVPQTDATELVQCVEYEFAGWAAINLLESATTTHNDRQFAAHLTTVKDQIETESEETPTTRDGDEETVSARPAQ
jgi:Polyketide cyclase / dehydrase and lipid transport.